MGRFLQEDEYRGDGLNLYAYCGNNPVVYYDPSGYVVRDPDAVSLGGGLYQYPNGSVRNEDGRYVSSGEKTPSTKKVYQDKEGNIFKYGDKRYRPPYAPGQIEDTYEAEKKRGNGKVLSHPSETEINWTPGTKREWDMGHIEGKEYIYSHDQYMRREYDPNDFANNEKMFVKEQQTAENFIPQTKSDNRKDNQKHSTLTKEEMKELGITEVDTDSDGKCK